MKPRKHQTFSYTFLSFSFCCSGSVLANESALEQHDTASHYTHESSVIDVKLPQILVTAAQQKKLGQVRFSADDLRKFPNQQESFTDLMVVHPNVQLSQSQNAAQQAGEIAPASISINGALPYSNQILLDGFSIQNKIIGTSSGDQLNSVTQIQANPIYSAVSTEDLCELNVLDSNIDAEYGAFTGGVIEAKTCRPNGPLGELQGQVSLNYTEDAWSKFHHQNDAEAQLLDDPTDSKNQSQFKIFGQRASLATQVTEALALSLNYQQRQSEIIQRADLLHTPSRAETRENQNLSLQGFYDINEQHSVRAQLNYLNTDSLQFISNYKNNGINTQTNSFSFGISTEHQLINGFFSQDFQLQQNHLDRNASSNEFIPWRWSTEKNWGNGSVSNEGAFGDLDYHQRSFNYAAKMAFLPSKHTFFDQQFNAGFGFSHHLTDWERPVESHIYFIPRINNSVLESCTTLDGELDQYCDLSFTQGGDRKGQFHRQRYLHRAGEVKKQQQEAHLFVSNHLVFSNHLKSTLGARLDYDKLTDQVNFSPRLSTEWQPIAKLGTTWTFGLNRYYDNSLFGYYLQDDVHRLSDLQVRQSIDDPWQYSAPSNIQAIEPHKLKNPYSDEVVLGMVQPLAHNIMSLKWVQRKHRDQIRLTTDENNPESSYYSNSGQSDADIYSLTWSHAEPIHFLNTKHQLHFAMDYTKVQRDFDHYDSPYTDSKYVVYRNQVIPQHERPASNYNQPWTLRLNWDMSFDALPIKMHHFLRYRSPTEARYVTDLPYEEQFEYQGSWVYSQVTEERIASRFNWDMYLDYAVFKKQDYAMNLGLSINNITNEKNAYYDQNANAMYSELGRQFILEWRLKF